MRSLASSQYDDPADATTAASSLVFNIQRYSIHDGPGIRTLVFLKGCALDCWWCANPESIGASAELAYVSGRCDGCGKCFAVCPEGALERLENGKAGLRRQRCNACGLCVAVCYSEALSIFGKRMSVKEVFDVVLKDKAFYEGSGGGVTVSGGEPMLHPRFVGALFEMCRKAGIGTAVETSGYCNAQALEQTLPLTDVVLFDLKLIDTEAHKRYTGQSNDIIMDNARLAVKKAASLLFRMPLIPGINDTQENVEATARFLQSLEARVNRIELMPYHRMGVDKGLWVGRVNRLAGLEPSDPAHVRSIQAAFEAAGTACTISR